MELADPTNVRSHSQKKRKAHTQLKGKNRDNCRSKQQSRQKTLRPELDRQLIIKLDAAASNIIVTTKLDTPVENETEEEADEEIERLDAELENINGVLAELKDKGQPCLLVRFSGCGGWTRIKACDCWRSSEGFDVASNVMWIEMGVTCLTCKGQFQGLWPTAMSSPSAVAAGGVDEAARKLSSNHSVDASLQQEELMKLLA
eukprot:scaffold85175_cov17-Tisochrysis_lutea.AAC.1